MYVNNNSSMEEQHFITNEEGMKKKRGRPRLYDSGAKAHEKEIKYSSQYYQNNKHKMIICECCDKEISYITKHQHLKTKTCQFIKALKAVKDQ